MRPTRAAARGRRPRAGTDRTAAGRGLLALAALALAGPVIGGPKPVVGASAGVALPGLPRPRPAPRSPAIDLPAGEDFRLANGMRVLLIENHEVPLVTLRARLTGGGAEDPPGKEGAAALLATLLKKGAGDRDAAAFQETVDFHGGVFESGADRRFLEVSAEFLARDLGLAISLLADALRRPTLTDAEFEKERGRAADALRARRARPQALMRDYYYTWLYPSHPYGRVPTGDEASLAALGPADIRAARDRLLAPARTRLVVAGDFDAAATRELVARAFGDWASDGPAPGFVARPLAAPGGAVLLVDKPDSLQTYFRFGNLATHWTSTDYPARMVANTILGGRFTSRLNTALRIKGGLTYGAGSRFDDTVGGAFYVSSYTATKTSAAALKLADEVYTKFVANGLTQAELDSARTYIQGQYAPDYVETAGQVAGMLLDLEADGLAPALIEGLFPALDRLRLAEVNAYIKRAFPLAGRRWVILGQAEKLRELAAGFGAVTEVKVSDPGFGPRP